MKIHQSLSERRNTLARMTLSLVNKPTALTTDERSRLTQLRYEMDSLETDLQAESRAKYYGAVKAFLRNGLNPSSHFPGVSAEEKRILQERRDLGTGGGAAGLAGVNNLGVNFVPMEFYDKVTSAEKYYGPLLDLATIIDTDHGAPLPLPEDNDATVAGTQVNENLDGPASDVSGLASVTLKSFKYSSLFIKVSMELVRDTGFDLEAYLVDRFAIRIARAVHPKLTNGVGTTEPYGIITQAAVAGTAAGAGTNDGSSGANTIGTDDATTLEKSVDPAYRSRGAHYMMHPNTLASMRSVKDKQGRPVFPGLQGGGVDTINNYPVALNPDMDQLQTQAGSPPITRKVLAFGDFSAYKIRRVRPTILRLEERFVDFGLVGFLMFHRMDANLIDGGGGAVKVLQNVY